MTFVYPLLLGGLLLAAVPVVLHFLVRKKPTTLLFPAFRFLMQKQRSNTRNLRLKHLLLLLLRIGLIVLVCAALARPRLFHESLGLSREKPVALVLIFDTSPSMDYKVGEVSRLDLAKRRSLEWLDQLPGDCRVLILDTEIVGQAFQPDLQGGSKSDMAWLTTEMARQRVQTLVIRPSGTPVNKAIDEAIRRLDTIDDASKNLPKVVAVFSDRTTPSWQITTSAKSESDVRLLYFDVGIDEPVDLAITQLDLPRDHRGEIRQSFTEGEMIQLHAMVKATGKAIASTIVCQIGSEKIAQAFEVEAGKQQSVMFAIDTAKFGLKPGLHQAEVKFDAATDALAFNNQRFVTFQIAEKPKVLVLADDLTRTSDFAFSLECLLCAVDHKTVAAKFDLRDYEAVFLVGVSVPEEKLWNELAEYVAQGRGLCVIPPGDELRLRAYDSAAALKVLPAGIQEKVTSKKGAMWDLEGNDFQHPFMLPFRTWRERGGIDFLRYPRRADHYWLVVPKEDREIVVRYDDQKPAVLEHLLGKGKVILLTTPMDDQPRDWNNYKARNTSFYVALTSLCVRHLISEAEKGSLNFQFGQGPPTFTRTLKDAFPKYRLSVGDSFEDVTFDDKDRWIGGHLNKSGNYILAGTIPDRQETKTIWQFSINVPGEESDLSRTPKVEIEAALGHDSVVSLDRDTPMASVLGPHWTEPMELFPWLLIAVLFFLALEGLLANRFYRQQTDDPPPAA